MSRATPPGDSPTKKGSRTPLGMWRAIEEQEPTAPGVPAPAELHASAAHVAAAPVAAPRAPAPPAPALHLAVAPVAAPAEGDAADDEDYPTLYRGDRPPRASSSRRLSPTLMRVFQRRREQIGLSLGQLAELSGIDQDELERFEGTQGNHRLRYDHAVVLARALGVPPEELPGLRPRAPRGDRVSVLGQLTAALAGGPLLVFEGLSGERYGGAVGEVERTAATPGGFAIKLGDDSLGDGWPRGALLGFVHEQPEPGDVALLRHQRSQQLALRRRGRSEWQGLAAWQPSLPTHSRDWRAVARMQVLLPRP